MSAAAAQKKGITVDDEDISRLKFAEGLENVDCLFASEVKEILQNRKQNHDTPGSQFAHLPLSNTFLRSLQYVQSFSSFSNAETSKQVRSNLEKSGLHPFELASLATLCPEKAEEAKVLIPSLYDKMDDDTLQTILDEMHQLKEYQGQS